jgi:hypothetical protein
MIRDDVVYPSAITSFCTFAYTVSNCMQNFNSTDAYTTLDDKYSTCVVGLYSGTADRDGVPFSWSRPGPVHTQSLKSMTSPSRRLHNVLAIGRRKSSMQSRELYVHSPSKRNLSLNIAGKLGYLPIELPAGLHVLISSHRLCRRELPRDHVSSLCRMRQVEGVAELRRVHDSRSTCAATTRATVFHFIVWMFRVW